MISNNNLFKIDVKKDFSGSAKLALFRNFSKTVHNAWSIVHISTNLVDKTHDKCILLVLRTH